LRYIRAMRWLVVLALLTATATATAEPEIKPLISLPAMLGGTTERAVVVGVRPEFVIARSEDRRGWGLGAYGELIGIHDDATLAGGATIVRYDHQFGIAPSVGYYSGTTAGIELGLFGGLRDWVNVDWFDVPVGLRLDARLATDGSHEKSASLMLAVDIATPMALLMTVISSGAH
jgi:hypothetical protein